MYACLTCIPGLLEKGGDGLIDSRKDTTFLTVSYTILRDHNKVFGIGLTVFGISCKAIADDGFLPLLAGWTDNVEAEATIHHNHFQNVNQRNPSTDNAL